MTPNELTAPFDLKTLRKSFAQNLADKGVSQKTTAKYLGDDDRVVSKYYQRVTDANEAAAIDVLDRLFELNSRTAKGQNAG